MRAPPGGAMPRSAGEARAAGGDPVRKSNEMEDTCKGEPTVFVTGRDPVAQRYNS